MLDSIDVHVDVDGQDRLPGTGKAGADRFRVCVRVRPIRTLLSRPPLVVDESRGRIDVRMAPDRRLRTFMYDDCLGPQATQDDVYARIGPGVLSWIAQGFNVALLAYGTTNSGKTHTCMGRVPDSPGLIPRIARQRVSCSSVGRSVLTRCPTQRPCSIVRRVPVGRCTCR